MIAAGDHVDASRKNLLGSFWSDARSAGGIFAVGHHEVHRVPRFDRWQQGTHGFSPRLAHDISDEQNLHWIQSKNRRAESRMRKSELNRYGSVNSKPELKFRIYLRTRPIFSCLPKP